MPTRPARPIRPLAALVLAALAPSCVGDRILKINSIPTGASVRLDDQLIGRTPLEISFKDYGIRRLSLYREGYRTYSEPLKLRAPLWAKFPIDIITEVILPLGIDDVREIQIDLVGDTGEEAAIASEEFAANARLARSGEDLIGVPIAGEILDKAPLEPATSGSASMAPNTP